MQTSKCDPASRVLTMTLHRELRPTIAKAIATLPCSDLVMTFSS
jgi:hypothetical protein